MATVLAPMICKVVGITVNVGDTVAENQTMFMIEAMKMEMPVVSPVAGTVKEIKVTVGQTVETDYVMAVVE